MILDTIPLPAGRGSASSGLRVHAKRNRDRQGAAREQALSAAACCVCAAISEGAVDLVAKIQVTHQPEQIVGMQAE